MPENADILFANEAFYLAFQTKDMRAMEVLLAHRQPVACTHPGWPSLSGRAQVMQSWAAILANPETRAIEMRGARAYRCGEAAFVKLGRARVGERRCVTVEI